MINHLTAPLPPPSPWKKPTAMSPLHAHYIVCSLALPPQPPHGHFAPPRNRERAQLGRRTKRPTQDGRRMEGLIDGFTSPRCLNNNRGTSLPPSFATWCQSRQSGRRYGRSGWRISKTGF